MKRLILIILPTLLLTACISTHFIKYDDSSYNKMNKELEGEEATVKLLNGDEITGVNVVVKSDSTAIREGKISTKTIKEITIKSHGIGALKGMAYGGLPTLILSGIIYLFTKDDPYSDFIFMLPPPVFVLGGLIGGIHGDIEKFVFPLTNIEYGSSIRIEISKVVEMHRNYIIVLWKDKFIHLLRSEYKYGEKAKDGKQIIIVPTEIFLEKFR